MIEIEDEEDDEDIDGEGQDSDEDGDAKKKKKGGKKAPLMPLGPDGKPNEECKQQWLSFANLKEVLFKKHNIKEVIQ